MKVIWFLSSKNLHANMEGSCIVGHKINIIIAIYIDSMMLIYGTRVAPTHNRRFEKHNKLKLTADQTWGHEE